MPAPSKTLDVRDAWTLRAFVIFYGLYCGTYLVLGISTRLRRASSKLAALKKSFRFLGLIVASTHCLIVYSLRPLMEHTSGSLRSWGCMLSIGHAVFCASESIISLSRMPLAILEKKHVTAFSIAIGVALTVAMTRVILNITCIAFFFGKDIDRNLSTPLRRLNIAATVSSMAGSGVFSATEVYVWFLTKRIKHVTSSPLTLRTMRLLATANLVGAVAGFMDVADQYLQLQTLEVIVLTAGMTTIVYYGILLGLDPLPSGDTHEAPMGEASYLSRDMSINIHGVAAIMHEKFVI
ncbi:hypothetical protein ANO11243_056260 [Dothideomycetidae sp. 11243]|nr:hypothetical protein ANO11243_056260 [fungal sp. No.11243]